MRPAREGVRTGRKHPERGRELSGPGASKARGESTLQHRIGWMRGDIDMSRPQKVFASPFRRVYRRRPSPRLKAFRARKKRRAKQIRRALRRAARTGTPRAPLVPGTEARSSFRTGQHRAPSHLQTLPLGEEHDWPAFSTTRSNVAPRRTPPAAPPTDPLELLEAMRDARRETDATPAEWSDGEIERIWKSTTD